MDFQKVLQGRRSHRDFLGEALPQTQIDALLKAALCAPNHKRNQPWRFTVIENKEIPKFWQKLEPHFSTVLGKRASEEVESKKKKLEGKLPKLGAIFHVTVLGDENPIRERENYAAACCAVQNMLLAATDMGLGSFWSTGEIFASPTCQRVLGIPEAEKFVGSIWFGKASDHPEAPDYSLELCTRHWRG